MSPRSYRNREGEVEHVFADAISDEARGIVFPARIRITGSRLREIENLLRADVAQVSRDGAGETPMRDATANVQRASDAASILSPGMSAQVELITGRRNEISYLLSPIARATSEAGRER